MDVRDILARLKKVRPSGDHRWMACCPAHDDKSPSFAINALPDGRILMHCFGGCGTDKILDALGITFGDLFPDPLVRYRLDRVRKPFTDREVLECLRDEAAIVALASSQVVEGEPLSAEDAMRVAVAAGRIASACEVAYGL
jgi:hypothetical protein